MSNYFNGLVGQKSVKNKLSFYLDASTNHVNNDDYTQVSMPLFYSDVSYSTTDGYPITWENSNYRKTTRRGIPVNLVRQTRKSTSHTFKFCPLNSNFC